MAKLLKNNKGRIVQVSDDAAIYLLSDKPTSTIEGVPLTNKKGQKVVIKKAEHEKGYSEPTKAEIDAFLKESAKTDAVVAKKESDEEAKKAAKEQAKADEAKAKADAKKAEADAAAKKTGGSGNPTPDN